MIIEEYVNEGPVPVESAAQALLYLEQATERHLNEPAYHVPKDDTLVLGGYVLILTLLVGFLLGRVL